jgi:hypothetical protein
MQHATCNLFKEISMQTMTLPVRTTNPALWSSRILSAVLILFMSFDSIIKIIQHPEAVTPTVAMGYAASLVMVLGIIELACLVLYLIPATSVLGAILLTGYLGGAVATQVRVGAEPFSLIFPFIIGAMVWGVLFLRDARIRALIPLRKSQS